MQKDKSDWQELKEGNRDSLSKIFIDFYDDLFRFAKRFEKDEDAIKDLIQDLFLKLWKNRKTLGNTENIKAYLFKSLQNIWNNKFNADKRRRESRLHHQVVFEYQSEDFIAHSEIDEIQRTKLFFELNKLPDKQREAIYLKYFQGFDIKEISEILNMNMQSVRNNLFRAMTKLRKNMLLQFFLSFL